jgi:glutamine synthetase
MTSRSALEQKSAGINGEFDKVIICVPDAFSRLVGKTINVQSFESAIRVGLPLPDFHLVTDATGTPIPGLAVTNHEGGFPNGTIRPDLSTLRLLPGVERTAIVLADPEHANGLAAVEAPRCVLQRQVDRLAEAGLVASVATELEFYMFSEDFRRAQLQKYQDLTPLYHRGGDHDVLIARNYEPYLEPLRARMEQMGAPVISTLGEGGTGQVEVNFTHGSPLLTADNHVLFKYIAKALALEMGVSISFMAKLEHLAPGSSSHIHLSLTELPTERPLFAHADRPDELAPEARHFIAGMLAYAPDFSILHAPSVNSYHRIRPRSWVPVNATWGVDNRTVLARLLGNGNDGRVEFRLPGADANPYLSLAAVIAAGLAGIENQLELPPPVGVQATTPQSTPVALPGDMAAAIDAFASSTVASDALGSSVHRHYLDRARHELYVTSSFVSDWERERGFEIA